MAYGKPKTKKKTKEAKKPTPPADAAPTARYPTQNKPWWGEKPKDVHRVLMPLVRSQFRNQGLRYSTMRRYIGCYEFGYRASERITSRDRAVDETTLFFNASQNVVDTIVSQVCLPKINPYMLPQGDAGWMLRRKAMDGNRGLAGERDRMEIDRLEEDSVRAFALTGGGFYKYVLTPWGEIQAERVSSLDMLFDEAESYYGQPLCWYIRYRMDRYQALELWGGDYEYAVGTEEERRKAIKKAERAIIDNDDYIPSDDIIEVVEAYRLPSHDHEEGDKDCDGRYAVIVEGQTLCFAPWYYRTPDVVHYIPKRSTAGMWGIPIMRQLIAGQREFEYTTQRLQKAHRRTGGATVMARRDSNIQARHLNNDFGVILEYDGQPPQEWNPAAANQQMYQYQDKLPTDMIRFVGSSEYSTQSSIPQGMYQTSGKALLLFEDAENKRFIEWHRERERLALRGSNVLMRKIKQCIAQHGSYKSRYVERKRYVDIDWKLLTEDLNDCELRVFPVSALSQTPSARFKELDALMNRGAITLDQFKKLFPLPTIDDELSIEIADREVIEMVLDKIVYEGKMIHPESFDKLDLALEIAGKFYNKMRQEDLPEDRMELLRNYMAEVQAKLADIAPPQQMPMAGQPQLPMGGGGPPGMPGMPVPSSAATALPPLGDANGAIPQPPMGEA